jgi:predicted AAA+ superfamily ATPase
MLRTIQQEFVHWKNSSSRRPLLLRGARQVGKTFAVRQFAQAHFVHCVELNFELSPDLRSIFSTLDPHAILRAVAEQFVGQELLAYSAPYEDAALFFWFREKRGSQAEVDYLCSTDGDVIPVEVKAGKTGRLRSLKQFMDEYNPPLGVRISQVPLSYAERVLSVPLYAIGQLPWLIREGLTARR